MSAFGVIADIQEDDNHGLTATSCLEPELACVEPSEARWTAVVTSANLTEAALDRNIEVGLLVRDRALAASVSSHFRGLIERGLLNPLPMA